MMKWALVVVELVILLWIFSPMIVKWVYAYTHSCYPSEMIRLRNGDAFYCFHSPKGGFGEPVFCPFIVYGLPFGCRQVSDICVRDNYLVSRGEASLCLYLPMDPYAKYTDFLMGMLFLGALAVVYATAVTLGGGGGEEGEGEEQDRGD